MTLDLGSVTPVAGECAIRIRDILRRAHGGFREDWLSDRFRYSPQRAKEISSAMEAAGYVELDSEQEPRNKSPFPWYLITDAGYDLVRASAAKRISRETAKTALAEFLQRVHLVNASPEYLYSVRCVTLFGSYLGSSERLGDVDVAVDLKPRVAIDRNHKWVELFRQHAWDSARNFSTWEEEVFWPRREVMLMLKSRKRSVSIQPWFSFVDMAKKEDFRYKVLFGDAKAVRRELARARREQPEVP